MSEATTYTCNCNGLPAPGAVCGHSIVGNRNLCGYKGDEFCEHRGEGCCECGAKTSKEAEKKCICSGDKDDCHGCQIWPD